MMTFNREVVDLFAGPGGWSLACQRLGLREMGIEIDKAAHETRRAAGFQTIRDSVTNWGPANFPKAKGLIASPPCQTFSMAGKGAGRAALDDVLRGVDDLVNHGEVIWERFTDERTGLVLEPLRWILEAISLGQPFRWIALEQVPTVQPVWDAYAEVLRDLGYSVATGRLQAEQYGVPQTRRRSILIASLDRRVYLPPPTHSRYYSRSPEKLDPGVKKWVSMAEALGWGMTARPSYTVTGGGSATGGPEPFAQSARKGMIAVRDGVGIASDRSNYGSGGDAANRGERLVTEPAFAVTTKVNRNIWLTANDKLANATVRHEGHPAPTITGGHDYQRWILRNNSSANAAERDLDQPAPTLYFGQRSNYCAWQSRPLEDQPDDTARPYRRPSTTIVGSFKPEIVAAPGYRVKTSRQNAEGSIKVTQQEAAVLQSFPHDFEWKGGKSKQYEQIGNAIPPLLAWHILQSVNEA